MRKEASNDNRPICRHISKVNLALASHWNCRGAFATAWWVEMATKTLDLDTLLLVRFFPKCIDCVKGHLGPEVESIEQEAAEDRYYDIKVTRCGHCNIPLRGEYLWNELFSVY